MVTQFTRFQACTRFHCVPFAKLIWLYITPDAVAAHGLIWLNSTLTSATWGSVTLLDLPGPTRFLGLTSKASGRENQLTNCNSYEIQSQKQMRQWGIKEKCQQKQSLFESPVFSTPRLLTSPSLNSCWVRLRDSSGPKAEQRAKVQLIRLRSKPTQTHAENVPGTEVP